MQRMTCKLGPRLEAVASFLPRGVRVADVGTDHGLLPAWLSLKGYASGIIASDIRQGPLEAAERTARRRVRISRVGRALRLLYIPFHLQEISPDEGRLFIFIHGIRFRRTGRRLQLSND